MQNLCDVCGAPLRGSNRIKGATLKSCQLCSSPCMLRVLHEQLGHNQEEAFESTRLQTLCEQIRQYLPLMPMHIGLCEGAFGSSTNSIASVSRTRILHHHAVYRWFEASIEDLQIELTQAKLDTLAAWYHTTQYIDRVHAYTRHPNRDHAIFPLSSNNSSRSLPPSAVQDLPT